MQAIELFPHSAGTVVHELGPPALEHRKAFFRAICNTLAHPPQPIITPPTEPPPPVRCCLAPPGQLLTATCRLICTHQSAGYRQRMDEQAIAFSACKAAGQRGVGKGGGFLESLYTEQRYVKPTLNAAALTDLVQCAR